ncbi:inverse autotransporter beta domain-containing protein, partial [Candidatus Pelagibacter bacterium]|nr:inverse autotransporter beta domain-containing protein [Candidatus Pelagibacter bacterium]
IKGVSLNKISEKVSSTVSNLIPGEGLTEVDVKLRDDNNGNGNYEFKILGVRDILPSDNSNLFTQFSLHTQEINSDKRIIGNLGLGYRFLNSDQSMMFGANTFYDQDLEENHKRVGLGFEAKAAMLDFNYNLYQKATNQLVISGTNEQVLSGQEYNITSQIPYMPWSTFNFQGYRMENEKTTQDVKGNIYSLEMALNPSLQFDILKDVSSVDGQEDEWEYMLTFTHPPRENKSTLADGLTSNEAFVKKDMQASLKDKVRRNNNLAVEIQGAITFTAK